MSTDYTTAKGLRTDKGRIPEGTVRIIGSRAGCGWSFGLCQYLTPGSSTSIGSVTVHAQRAASAVEIFKRWLREQAADHRLDIEVTEAPGQNLDRNTTASYHATVVFSHIKASAPTS